MVTNYLEGHSPPFAQHEIIETVECKTGIMRLVTIEDRIQRHVELSHNARS
jgi:hypothetical protein